MKKLSGIICFIALCTQVFWSVAFAVPSPRCQNTSSAKNFTQLADQSTQKKSTAAHTACTCENHGDAFLIKNQLNIEPTTPPHTDVPAPSCTCNYWKTINQAALHTWIETKENTSKIADFSLSALSARRKIQRATQRALYSHAPPPWRDTAHFQRSNYSSLHWGVFLF